MAKKKSQPITRIRSKQDLWVSCWSRWSWSWILLIKNKVWTLDRWIAAAAANGLANHHIFSGYDRHDHDRHSSSAKIEGLIFETIFIWSDRPSQRWSEANGANRAYMLLICIETQSSGFCTTLHWLRHGMAGRRIRVRLTKKFKFSSSFFSLPLLLLRSVQLANLGWRQFMFASN